MNDRFTIDSSVIVSSLLKDEIHYQKARDIWNQVLTKQIVAILPSTVLIEVSAAIRRKTGSEELAIEIANEIYLLDSVIFVEIDKQRALKTANLNAKYGLRGMDAVLMQVSREFKSRLVTFDKEIIEKLHIADL